jgi:Predicted integral membrane protein
MNWFYATKEKTQAGPVDEATLKALLQSGTITPETLIWKEGMDNWKPYSRVFLLAAPSEAPATLGAVTCAECGQSFSPDQTVSIAGRRVCAGCKPVALQRFQEGGARLADPEDPDALWEKVVANGGKARLEEVLRGAWKTYSGNFGPCLGVTLLAYLITTGPGYIPYLGYFLIIPMMLFVQQQMMAGLQWYFLKQIRGGQAILDDAFTGFRRGFWQQTLFMLIYVAVTFALIIPFLLLAFAMGSFKEGDPPILLIALISVPALILMYLGIRWFFTSIIILDKGQPVLAAMKLSGRAAHRNFGMFLLMSLVVMILALAGLCTCAGIFLILPYITAIIAHTYDQIFGQEGSIEKI